ncbi:ribonuclease H-like domain-containing protein [Xylaria cf. heliscus]|nr:ribonuclease H-like domain-containing protein [Xylaria cf. heliscus]
MAPHTNATIPAHAAGQEEASKASNLNDVVSSPFENVPAVPDPEVTRIENLVLSSTPAAFASLSLRELFPTRPSYGTQGKSLVLRANYFTLDPSLKLILYRYDWFVKDPQDDKSQDGEQPKGKKKKKGEELVGKRLGRVIELCLESPELAEFQHDIATDFRAILISTRDIEDQEITVSYRGEGEDEPRQRATQYTMLLKKCKKGSKTIHAVDLISYLKSTDLNAQYDSRLDAVQALNILMNHHSKSSSAITSLGTSKSFSLVNPEYYDLGGGLKAMRGFFTSVRAATARMLLNVNVSHAAFYNDVPLEELMKSFLSSNDNNLFRLAAFVKKLRVDVTYLHKKNKNGIITPRVKTIYGLAGQDDGSRNSENRPRVKRYGAGAKEVEFWLNGTGGKSSSSPKKKAGEPTSAGGRYVSVYDYFLNTYRIKIQDLRIPVINVGSKEDPSYIPAQVCRVMPGQRANRHLSALQTTRMIDFAVRGPADNAQSIVSKGLSTAGISDNTSSQPSRFGLTILSKLITVEGRVLQEPQVVYRQQKARIAQSSSWNMFSGTVPLKFAARGVLRGGWAILVVTMPTVYGSAKTFSSEAQKDLGGKIRTVLQQTDIDIQGKWNGILTIALRDTDDTALDNAIWRAVEERHMQLLFVVLPATQMPLYNRLKQLADVKYGLHTICIVGSKISTEKGQDQYLRNIALKVNLKLGGQNHHVQSDGLQIINENKTMIVGIDVTHPSPGSASNAPSISAMVASIDSKLSQWPGTLRIQDKKREEMVSDLKMMLQSRLDLWISLRRPPVYPENILVYRDGVSEGQYSTVLEEELPQLRAACEEYYPVPDQKKGLPRMTLVIVGKRHHTRFYATKASDADKSGNPRAGTVVDRGVTEARNWDFFLQSHSAIKGTARPAHYFVLLDEIFRHRYGKVPGKNVADELQVTTQSLCWTFGRATKAVSYCTPAYLADILCERASSKASTTGSDLPSDTSSVDMGGATTTEVPIHKNLKNTMFYI